MQAKTIACFFIKIILLLSINSFMNVLNQLLESFNGLSKYRKFDIIKKIMNTFVPIETFNIFFKSLNVLHINPTMKIYHYYYEPNKITFNTLLKGVRLSEPVII